MFLFGGAGGLAYSPGYRCADGEIIIGTNWTLRTMEPSLWTVYDKPVWIAERGMLDGRPNTLAVVNKKVFGGGYISPSHSRHLRMIGKGQAKITEISISSFKDNEKPPYLPTKLSDPLFPAGNSLAYGVQIAHLMGASEIIATGFTFKSGSPYQHKGGNPATRLPVAKYGIIETPLAWLEWYCRKHPNRLRLDVSFSGPLYERLPESLAPRFEG